MKMFDMGYKEEGLGVEVPSKSEKKIRYPSLYLNNKVPDDLMDKDVGHMCRIEIIGKVVSKGIDEGQSRKRENLTIEIHKIGYISKAGKATKEEYKKMSDKEKEEYNKRDVGL